jgi:DNA-binding CsgD family transcriptional regulator
MTGNASLWDLVAELRSARDLRAAAAVLHRSARAIGVTHVAVVADVSHPDAPCDENGESLVELLGWPAAFIDDWLARGYSVGSASMVAARLHHLPFAWPPLEPAAAPAAARAADSVLATLGITGDVIVPIRLPRGRFALVSWMGPVPPSEAARLAHEHGPALLLLAHYFLERVRMASDPPTVAEDLARLTPRELECLTLVAKGASDAEAGQTLGLSERTVRFHMTNAAEKLGARSRSHAVALATQLGIVGSVF